MLRREADKAAAGLGAAPVAGTYAGLRPATDSADYRIELVEGRQWVSCGRIERVVAQNVRLPSVWRVPQNRQESRPSAHQPSLTLLGHSGGDPLNRLNCLARDRQARREAVWRCAARRRAPPPRPHLLTLDAAAFSRGDSRILS